MTEFITSLVAFIVALGLLVRGAHHYKVRQLVQL